LTIEASFRKEYFLIIVKKGNKTDINSTKCKNVPFVSVLESGTKIIDGVDFTSPSSFLVVLSPWLGYSYNFKLRQANTCG
jgi:hypothetical protein